MKMTLLALPALAVFAATANAALIEGLTLESATDNPWNAGSGMYPIKAINGEGLPGGTPALSGTHDNSMPNNWWSTTVPAQITINLGGNYAVDTIHVWNYNENGFTTRGTQNVEIHVSPDGDIANLVKLVTNGTGGYDNGSGGFLLPQSPGGDIPGFDLDLGSVTNASLLANVRLIRLIPLDNHGDFGVGLAEVQFGGVAVQEPSSALIEGLTVESATTNPWTAGNGMLPEKAINGAGLPGGTPALSGTHDASMPNNWWSTDVPAQITINLGGNYAVDTVHVWNYNENGFTTRGTQNVEIHVSPDGDIANLVKLATNGTGGYDNGSGDFLFPQSPGGDITGFDLDLGSVTNASLLANVRLIQFIPLDNHGDFGVGLAEVQFSGRIAPAPSTGFQLIITSNGANYDFEWDSQPGKLYDLVSATDFSTAISTWPVWDSQADLAATSPSNTLTNVPGGGDAKRFFAVIEKERPPLLDENFDAASTLPTGWVSNGPVSGTDWGVGTPSGVASGPSAANSVPNCAGTNIGGYYTENTDVSLVSPALAIPAGYGASLSFQQFIDTDLTGSPSDVGSVRILDADNGDMPIAGLEILNLEGLGTVGWKENMLNLPVGDVGGKNIKVEFRFVSNAGTIVDSDVWGGFYVDDVFVTATAP